MIKDCAYEGCSLKVDALKNQDIKIQIEAFNGILEPDVFTVTVMFHPQKKLKGFSFDPSRALIGLPDGTVIDAEGLSCQYTIYIT